MLYHLQQGAVDALYGSSELLLYGTEKLITKFSLVHETMESIGKNGSMQKKSQLKPDLSSFTWVDTDQCRKVLGDISSENFVDALFLAGSSRLRAFPLLKDSSQYPQPFTFQNAVDLLLSSNGNVIRLCEQYAQNNAVAEINWVDEYMRSVQAMKHMIILIRHDMVKPRSYQSTTRATQAPADLHELVGLALPEELHYYLYRGLIGPRVMGWLISGLIKIQAPHAGGESEQYRTLMKNQLHPLRRQAISLLAFSMNRWYQQKEIRTSFWFESDTDLSFNLRENPPPKKEISSWRVRTSLILERAREMQVTQTPQTNRLRTLSN